MGAIETVERPQLTERPPMRSGDTVRVHVRVREGDKERIQIFEGVVIGLHRGGARASFTVRKVSFGQGVERIFPLHSPTIQKVEVGTVGQGATRQAVLPARAEGQGRAHAGERPRRQDARLIGRGPAGRCPALRRRARSRTRCGAPASCTWRASTKWDAAVWPARSWRPPSSSIPIAISPELSDSKAVPAEERETLYDRIVRDAVAWAVASLEPVDIDRLNIHQASLRAMQRSVLALAPLPDIVLVDAFRVPDLPMAQRGVIHGDRRCAAIAAASIVAKVTRDRQMRVLHALDPRYGFDRHKGYATADHLQAVARFGYSARIVGRSGPRRCLIRWTERTHCRSLTTRGHRSRNRP